MDLFVLILIWIKFTLVLCKSSTLIGIAVKDGTIISSTTGLSSNGLMIQDSFEWIHAIGETIILGMHGDPTDCNLLISKIKAYEFNQRFKLNCPLSCHQLAYYCRHLIADSLRSSHPYEVDLLIGGYDITLKRSLLYSIDRVASIKQVSYITHGKYTPILLSILDRLCNQPHLSSSSSLSSTLSTPISSSHTSLQTILNGYEIIIKCWEEYDLRALLKIKKCSLLSIDSHHKIVSHKWQPNTYTSL